MSASMAANPFVFRHLPTSLPPILVEHHDSPFAPPDKEPPLPTLAPPPSHLTLPPLRALPDVPLDHLATLTPLAAFIATPADAIRADSDVWTRASSLVQQPQPCLRTWHVDLAPTRAIAADTPGPCLPVPGPRGDGAFQPGFWLGCLRLLGQGRPSVLFARRKRSFDVYRGGAFHVHGIGEAERESLVSTWLRLGERVVRLRAFAAASHSAATAGPAEVILASCMDTLLDADCARLDAAAEEGLESVVQLQDMSVATFHLLDCLCTLATACEAAGDQPITQSLLLAIVDQKNCPLRSTLAAVALQITEPIVRRLVRALGLVGPDALLDQHDDDVPELDSLIPFLFDDEAQSAILNIRTALEMIAHVDAAAGQLEALQTLQELNLYDLCAGQASLDDIEQSAIRYRERAEALLQDNDPAAVPASLTDEPPPATALVVDAQQAFKQLGEAFFLPPSQNPNSINGRIIHAYNADLASNPNGGMYEPLDDILASTHRLTPFLLAQQHILDRLALALLLNTLCLPAHLSAHRQFQLFGNGLFIQRLTPMLDSLASLALTQQTLPNPDPDSDTDRAHISALAKAHAALSDLLVETYLSPSSATAPPKQVAPPGNLSLTISAPPLSHSGAAMLRIQHRPPPALSLFFNPDTEATYAEVSGILLALLAAQHRVARASAALLARPSHPVAPAPHPHPTATRRRALLAARAAIATLTSYAFDLAVAPPWSALAAALASAATQRNDAPRPSVRDLVAAHAAALRAVRARLFLAPGLEGAADAWDAVVGAVRCVCGGVGGDGDAEVEDALTALQGAVAALEAAAAAAVAVAVGDDDGPRADGGAVRAWAILCAELRCLVGGGGAGAARRAEGGSDEDEDEDFETGLETE